MTSGHVKRYSRFYGPKWSFPRHFCCRNRVPMHRQWENKTDHKGGFSSYVPLLKRLAACEVSLFSLWQSQSILKWDVKGSALSQSFIARSSGCAFMWPCNTPILEIPWKLHIIESFIYINWSVVCLNSYFYLQNYFAQSVSEIETKSRMNNGMLKLSGDELQPTTAILSDNLWSLCIHSKIKCICNLPFFAPTFSSIL